MAFITEKHSNQKVKKEWSICFSASPQGQLIFMITMVMIDLSLQRKPKATFL